MATATMNPITPIAAPAPVSAQPTDAPLPDFVQRDLAKVSQPASAVSEPPLPDFVRNDLAKLEQPQAQANPQQDLAASHVPGRAMEAFANFSYPIARGLATKAAWLADTLGIPAQSLHDSISSIERYHDQFIPMIREAAGIKGSDFVRDALNTAAEGAGGIVDMLPALIATGPIGGAAGAGAIRLGAGKLLGRAAAGAAHFGAAEAINAPFDATLGERAVGAAKSAAMGTVLGPVMAIEGRAARMAAEAAIGAGPAIVQGGTPGQVAGSAASMLAFELLPRPPKQPKTADLLKSQGFDPKVAEEVDRLLAFKSKRNEIRAGELAKAERARLAAIEQPPPTAEARQSAGLEELPVSPSAPLTQAVPKSDYEVPRDVWANVGGPDNRAAMPDDIKPLSPRMPTAEQPRPEAMDQPVGNVPPGSPETLATPITLETIASKEGLFPRPSEEMLASAEARIKTLDEILRQRGRSTEDLLSEAEARTSKLEGVSIEDLLTGAEGRVKALEGPSNEDLLSGAEGRVGAMEETLRQRGKPLEDLLTEAEQRVSRMEDLTKSRRERARQDRTPVEDLLTEAEQRVNVLRKAVNAPKERARQDNMTINDLLDETERRVNSIEDTLPDHIIGRERSFAFDPGETTDKSGFFRLLPQGHITRKSTGQGKTGTIGVRELRGIDRRTGLTTTYALLFDKSKFSEQQAREWFETRKHRYGFNKPIEKGGDLNAQQEQGTTRIRGDVVNPEGAGEAQGGGKEANAPEGGEGIPQGGQGVVRGAGNSAGTATEGAQVREEGEVAKPIPAGEPLAPAPTAAPAAQTAAGGTPPAAPAKQPWEMPYREFLESRATNPDTLKPGAEDAWWDKATKTRRGLYDNVTKMPMVAAEENGKFKVANAGKIRSYDSKREAYLGFKRQNAPTAADRELIDLHGGLSRPRGSGHEILTQVAVAQGKPVPRAVLEEYRGQPWADSARAKAEPPRKGNFNTPEEIEQLRIQMKEQRAKHTKKYLRDTNQEGMNPDKINREFWDKTYFTFNHKMQDVARRVADDSGVLGGDEFTPKTMTEAGFDSDTMYGIDEGTAGMLHWMNKLNLARRVYESGKAKEPSSKYFKTIQAEAAPKLEAGKGFIASDEGKLHLEPLIEAATAARRWTQDSIRSASEWLTRTAGDTISSLKDAIRHLVTRFGDAIRSYVPRIYAEFKRFIKSDKGAMAMPGGGKGGKNGVEGTPPRSTAKAEAIPDPRKELNDYLSGLRASYNASYKAHETTTSIFTSQAAFDAVNNLIPSDMAPGLRKWLKRAFGKEFQQNPFVSDTMGEVETNTLAGKNALTSIINIMVNESATPQERQALKFYLDPQAFREVMQSTTPKEFEAKFGATKQKFKELMIEQTKLAKSIGVTIREANLGPDEYYMPHIYGQYSRIGSRIYSTGTEGQRVKISKDMQTQLSQPESLNYWRVVDNKNKPIEGQLFDSEAEAQAFIDNFKGGDKVGEPDKPYGVTYTAINENGKRVRTQEWFATIKEQRDFVNDPLNQEGHPDSFRVTGMQHNKSSLSIAHPLSFMEKVAYGLSTDIIADLQHLIRQNKAINQLAGLHTLAKGRDNPLMSNVWIAKDQPAPTGWIKASDLKLNIPKSMMRDADLTDFMDGWVERSFGEQLAGMYGKGYGLFDQLGRFISAIDKPWRIAATYLNPFRYPKQIAENNVNMAFWNMKAFLDVQNRWESTTSFWGWFGGKKAHPITEEFLQHNVAGHNMIQGTDMSDVSTLLSSAIDPATQAARLMTWFEHSAAGKGVDFFRHLYSAQDDATKHAAFWWLRTKGGKSAAEAAAEVKATFFDFNNAPPLVRKLARYIPFAPSVMYQFARTHGNMIKANPGTMMLKYALAFGGFAWLRQETDKRNGITPERRRRLDLKFGQFAIGKKDNFGHEITSNLSWLLPYQGIVQVPDNWKEVRQVGRALFPMFTQGGFTFFTQQDRFGHQIIYHIAPENRQATPAQQKQAAKENKNLWLSVAGDELPVMFGQYWTSLYKNAQKKPSKQQPLWAQALTGPAAGVKSAIPYP